VKLGQCGRGGYRLVLEHSLILGLDENNVFVMHTCQRLCGFYACSIMVMVFVHEVIAFSWCLHA